MRTMIGTTHLPPAERFPFWLETVYQTVVPLDIRTEHTADYPARICAVDLGAVQVTIHRQPAVQATRTAKLIRQCDPEVYHLAASVDAHATAIQNRQTAALTGNMLTLYDCSRPFRSVLHTGESTAMLVQFPHTLLPLPPNKVSHLLATPLPGQTGIGSLLLGYLLRLTTHADDYGPADAVRLGAITLDLVTALLAHRLDIQHPLPPQSDDWILLTRIHAYIQRHLAAPTLNPQTIASAHHISIRSLHRLFQTYCSSTVGQWIRDRRLDRCRHDLTDPVSRDRPTHAIAARWGFTDPAHFSRTFRAAYGLSPSTYRQQHR